jgi:hypothetical protein
MQQESANHVKYKISNSNLMLKCFICIQDCIVTVINEGRSRQHWWNDTKWKETEVLTEKLLIVALLLQKTARGLVWD